MRRADLADLQAVINTIEATVEDLFKGRWVTAELATEIQDYVLSSLRATHYGRELDEGRMGVRVMAPFGTYARVAVDVIEDPTPEHISIKVVSAV